MPKRAVDLVGASIALLLLTPILVILVVLIRVVVGGPAIYAQQRIGFRGKAFVCYKFRTMAVDAEEKLDQYLACNAEAAMEWRATRKLVNDPRVTCLGKVLRKSSLDELPQLFNVLRGDMSLVGPRPIVSDEVKCYGRHAIMYGAARPGLTGVWQTSGRTRLTYRTQIALDRYYVRNWSLWLISCCWSRPYRLSRGSNRPPRVGFANHDPNRERAHDSIEGAAATAHNAGDCRPARRMSATRSRRNLPRLSRGAFFRLTQ